MSLSSLPGTAGACSGVGNIRQKHSDHTLPGVTSSSLAKSNQSGGSEDGVDSIFLFLLTQLTLHEGIQMAQK